MKNEFTISNGNALLNFTIKYCSTEQELLDSKGFKKVVDRYIKQLEKRNDVIFDRLIEINKIPSDITENMINIFKLLISFESNEVARMGETYRVLLSERNLMIEFIEGLYSYWRRIDRYAVIHSSADGQGLQKINFIESTNNFTNLVLKVYRRIEETVLRNKHTVYRQLPAGVNGGIVLRKSAWDAPSIYQELKDIYFIEQIVLRPPFITYPKKNKRSGTYQESLTNPIDGLSFNTEEFMCYPAKIGEYLAYIYFHRDFMCHGVTLCNLFELATVEEFEDKKPDIVYVFGASDGRKEMYTTFYHDKDNDIMLGFCNNHSDIDYFGYMKKMCLTLHNVRQINNGNLPIHGAMVNIKLKDGKEANVCIIGDSGAGKSESLEAFNKLSEKYLKHMKVIFDDMGTFKIKNNRVVGYGTEIGAFVRLDDLDIGYAYKEIDRSIFMNPDKINSRIVIPVSRYEDIMKGYPVDMVLYANNYEDSPEKLTFFKDKDEAINIFKSGARKAKGTTTEEGIVTSYFANPFGPVQKQEQCDILLEKYFKLLFNAKIPVGVIYTQLAIDGKEQDGPKEAAIKLFNWIKEK